MRLVSIEIRRQPQRPRILNGITLIELILETELGSHASVDHALAGVKA
jgi:hypothetical protein